MKNRIFKTFTTLSIVAGSAFVGSAQAAIVSGSSFTAIGNGYTSLDQLDFVGPPPSVSPLPQTIDDDGYFSVIASPAGGFTDAIFNPPQTILPRASSIKDISGGLIAPDGNGGSVVDQLGPLPDGSDDPLRYVDNFIAFNNAPFGGTTNFTIDLFTVLRRVNTGNPLNNATLIKDISFDYTGELTDETTGKVFDAVGSLTPNIGPGSSLEGITFGDLANNPGQFFGSIGYTMDWRVEDKKTPEPMTGIGVLVALGFASTTLRNRKNKSKKQA
jgi:hypothetical protein